MNDIESESAASEENAEALNKMRAVAAEELDKQRAENEKLKGEREIKNSRYHDLQLQLSAENNTIEFEKSNRQRLDAEKQTLKEKLSEIRGSIDNIQLTIEELDKEAEKKALTDEEQREVEKLRLEIERMGKDKQALNGEQIELENRRNELVAAVSRCMDKKSRCEVEISRIETNLENLKLRIDEEYHLSYDECLALKADEFDVTSAAGEISSLKRKITMLGRCESSRDRGLRRAENPLR